MKKISKIILSLLCTTMFVSCEGTNDNNSSNNSSETNTNSISSSSLEPSISNSNGSIASFSSIDGNNYLSQNGLIYELDGVIAVVVGHTDELSNNVVIPPYITFNNVRYEVSMIKKGAFYNCNSLTSIFIPEGVVNIREGAFEGCNSLTIYCEARELELESDWNFYRPVYWGVTQEEIIYQDGLQFLIINGNAVITGYTNELSKKLVVPETIIVDNAKYNVTSIGASAFRDCNLLFSVTFEKGSKVTSIKEGAFFRCSSLTSVAIPNSVTNIENYTFKECCSLTIYCEASSKPSEWDLYWNASYRPVYWGVTLEEIIYQNGLQLLIIDGNGIVTGHTNELLKNVVIPATISLSGTTYNVTSIGDYAFYNYNYITSVTFEEGSKLTSIGEGAFYNCSSLVLITIPNFTTSIGEQAFFGCRALTSIEIPNSVTIIEDRTFYGCSSLRFNEYGNCLYLGNVENPYLILIKAKDTSITEATISNNTRFIMDYAFQKCSYLTSLIIPSSVLNIGEGAFADCYNLIIFSKVTTKPSAWSIDWGYSNRPVYWAGQWSYIDGVPTPNK